MTPFCVEKLILEMDYSFSSIKNSLVKSKFLFCNSFKKEINLSHDIYAEEIFDFIYNIFAFKKAIKKKDFTCWLDNFRDSDFKNEVDTRLNLKTIYMQMLFSYKKYFMDYFRLDYENDEYLKRKVEEDKSGFINKILEYGI